jgi:transposase
MATPEPKLVGAAPLIRAMCEAIGLREVIDENVEWDDRRCKLSPGERIQALVIDVLTGRHPLYHVWEGFERTDCELLLGEGVCPEDLNDDALARALDKLQAANPRLVFSLITSRAMVAEQVDYRFLHWDSTTRSLFGEYPTATGEGAVKPTYGFSKDKRPDLKQIVLAILGNREGIPLFGEVRDGNSSDKKANGEMIEALCQWFSPAELRRSVYVADSALVTHSNLEALEQAQLHFLSRLPETYGVAAQVKAAAWAGPWQSIGTISPRRDAASYWASEQTGTIEGRTYRLVVYRSDHLDRRKAKTLERELAAEQKRLVEDAEELGRRRFACEADARAAAEQWLQAHGDRRFTVTTTVEEIRERQKQNHRGRPRKNEQPSWQTYHRARVTVGNRDQEQVEAELQRRSAFVLITNLPADEFPPERLLVEYKQQTSLEQRFHFMKDPAFVDAFFLHKPERVEALGYVLLIACLVFSLLERRVRRAGKPLDTPSRGKLVNPTGFEVLHHMKGAIVVATDRYHREVHVSISFRRPFRAILEMAGFDVRIYTQVPRRDYG